MTSGAQHGVATVLGSGSDPFQPGVIPFNVGAITCGYLAGAALAVAADASVTLIMEWIEQAAAVPGYRYLPRGTRCGTRAW